MTYGSASNSNNTEEGVSANRNFKKNRNTCVVESKEESNGNSAESKILSE